MVMTVLGFPNGIFNRSVKVFDLPRYLKEKKTHPKASNAKFV